MVNRNAHNENFPVSDRYMRTKKKAIESLYCGRMRVEEVEMVRDRNTHISEAVPVTVYEDIPCRLIYQDSTVTTDNEPATAAKQVRVMCNNEIEIKDGSLITITQHGKTASYRRGGIARHYSDHQTIPLTAEKYS